MRFGISAHPSSIHPSSFHPAELHPVENNHPSGSKPGGNEIEKPGSPVVTSGHDPFPPSSSGLPTSSSPMMSPLRDIKLHDDPGNYAIRNTPEEDGSYKLYIHDPETDAPKDTGNYVKPDRHRGWERVGNPDAAKQVANPALPPAAKISSGELGELNEKGLFPDGKGNEFALMGEKHYQMKYDQQLGGYRAVDPRKPNTFQGSIPVKLDGKGGAEPLTAARLEGGMDNQRQGPSASSKGSRDEVVTRLRALKVVESELESRSRKDDRNFDAATKDMNKNRYATFEQVERWAQVRDKSDASYHDLANAQLAVKYAQREFNNQSN
jgi:hypothetical protein